MLKGVPSSWTCRESNSYHLKTVQKPNHPRYQLGYWPDNEIWVTSYTQVWQDYDVCDANGDVIVPGFVCTPRLSHANKKIYSRLLANSKEYDHIDSFHFDDELNGIYKKKTERIQSENCRYDRMPFNLCVNLFVQSVGGIGHLCSARQSCV